MARLYGPVGKSCYIRCQHNFDDHAKPMMIKAMMAMTLTIENQNSLSPKPLTVMALIAKITQEK
jgi:hypothetical protein